MTIVSALSKRGSAPLLVFGFLCHMMISSVSFGNERCTIADYQPVSSNILSQTRPANISLQAKFQTALGNALTNRLPSGAGVGGDLMATLIADYLDTDSIPKRLNMPSTEMVPMVSQILAPSYFTPMVIMRQVPVFGTVPPRNKKIYSLQLMGDPLTARLDVELVWPFKNQNSKTPQSAFKVIVQGYLKVIKQHEEMKSQSFTDAPTAYVPLTGTANVPDFWNKDTSDPANCYAHAAVRLSTPDPAKMTVDVIDSENGVIPGSGFIEHQPFSVAMVVFVQVTLGADVVDSVPQLSPYPGFDVPAAEFIAVPKLFFQTVASSPVERTMAVNLPIPYEWSSLEVPDPRFNYKAANWIKNDAEAGTALTPRVNPSTVALLGKDGRDGDIYMAVSNIGFLQTPGELGFIVRPFPYDPTGANVDFRTQTSADEAEDKDFMFRTIRLYDHGVPVTENDIARTRDGIYENFKMRRNPDGTLPGRVCVDPRSDLPQVLFAAVKDTPVDYYWAGKKAAGVTPVVFNKTLDSASWKSFTNGWFNCLQNAKATPSYNTSLDSKLSDVYGRQELFGWYSAGDAKTVFQTSPGFAQTLAAPLQEIDRKMLYSYSLDNFTERQQLFLYMLCLKETLSGKGDSCTLYK